MLIPATRALRKGQKAALSPLSKLSPSISCKKQTATQQPARETRQQTHPSTALTATRRVSQHRFPLLLPCWDIKSIFAHPTPPPPS